MVQQDQHAQPNQLDRRRGVWLQIGADTYLVHDLRPLPLFAQVFRLIGVHESVVVGMSLAGPVCTCREWQLGCRHTRALQDQGLLTEPDVGRLQAETRRLFGGGG